MADDEDQSSKTEDATPRKLQRLRDEGQVPQSREINNLFALIGMMALVAGVGSWSLTQLAQLGAGVINNAGTVELPDGQAMGAVLLHSLGSAGLALLPIFIIFIVLGVFGGYIQHGGVFSTKTIEPNLQKISPLAGFKRLFGLQAVAEFIKNIVKLAILGIALGVFIYTARDELVSLVDTEPENLLVKLQSLSIKLVGTALAIMALIAAADYLFQRFKFMRDNMMSHKELKDEFRDTEGDPHIKQRQRQIRLDRARKRMMSAVPLADVVVTNPTHYAVALRYKPEEGDAAPTVVAKGVEAVALRIREVAKEHNVPLYEDPPLARLLYAQVELDQTIPVQLYELVAKVMAFVFDLRKRQKAS
jgi:flagellar biosynthetic protein FlhB